MIEIFWLTLIWCIVLIGFSYILSISKIFKPVRSWLSDNWVWGYNLMKCPMCNAFWIGLVLSFFMFSPTNIWLLDGLFASGVMLLVHSLLYRRVSEM